MPFITKLGAVAARAYGWLASVAQAVVSSDTYFYLVSMLLPGNGTNGATNNTFLDSSTNSFTITRNGNTTQGTFSPFSQTGWSNYFDGTGDYLVPSSSSIANFGTGDFSVEMFVNLQALGSDRCLLDGRSAATDNCVFMQITTANQIGFGSIVGGAVSYFVTSTSTMSVGDWVHVAVTRAGTSLRLFFNGVLQAVATNSTNFVSGTNRPTIGATGFTAGSNVLLGYISNLRIVKGVALYTNSFTPPATPLTAVSGTSLLTCQSNRIVDNSANNFTITRNGDVAVQAFSPFVPNNISPTSYSGWFDGSGDYLSIPDNAAFDLAASDWTLETWVNFSALPASTGAATFASQWRSVSSTSFGWFCYLYNNSGTYQLYLSYSTTGANQVNLLVNLASAPIIGTWNHVAFVRSGNNFLFFWNGIQVGSTQTLNATIFNSTTEVWVGAQNAGGTANYLLTGALSNLRIVKGTAVYTSNFTPSTTPLTAIANTSLLTCQNATFIDNSTNAFTITVNGNAQPITNNPFQTPSPNPISYSGYFDGSGDYLTAPANAAFNFGTGDFTIEAWVYTPTTQTQYAPIACNYNNPDGWFLSFSTSNLVTFSNYNVTALTSSSSVPTSTWTHIAVARSGTSLKMFFNGVQVASATNSTTYGVTAATSYIGFNNQTHYFSGFISNVRVVKGTALYTANFIPSNTPLTAVSGTSLLTCQDNRFVDNSTNAFAITVNGNTTPVMTNPYGYATPISSTAYGGAFDGGTTTRLTFPSNTAFAFGTGAYTMEAWVYLTSYATTFSTAIFDCGSTTNSAGMFVTTSGALFLNLYGVGSVIQTSTTIPLNTWTHIAISRQSTAASSTRLFINGVLGATGTDSNNWTVTTTPGVGGIGLAGYTVSGFVSNVRIVKGTAVYTAAFTPSTTPLTAISGTSLLTCQNIVFADNSSNAFTVTVNGNTAPTPVNPFGYSAPAAPTPVSYSALTNGGSGYFDGTGDYLTFPQNAAFNLTTSDFTIDGWVYYTSTPAAGPIFSIDATSYPSLLIQNESGVLKAYATSASVSWDILNGMSFGSISANTWAHFALTRSGSTFRTFLNGVLGTTVTSSASIENQGGTGRVGASDVYVLLGYLSSFRVIKGTALYTAAFAPPVLPLTAVSNTQLLLNYTNAGIADAASQNDLETVGNAQISTAQSKFGGGSMLFDGTGDWLLIPHQPTQFLSTGNFTIEMWVYRNSSGTYGLVGKGTATTGWLVSLNSSNQVVFTYGSSTITSTGTVSATTWTFIAVVRSGTSTNQTKIYINGTNDGTGTVSTDFSQTNSMYVGADRTGGSNFNGYIDDLRITKYARYTANFTPPTAAFPTQ